MLSADDITLSEFKETLKRYPDLIKTLSKPKKDGQLTLEELDKFRYVEAPSQFSIKSGGRTMELVDVRKLVDWKIRHGQFRPTLPKLVASNPGPLIPSTLTTAFTLYNQDPTNLKPTLTKIAELRGIGPATASLILSIYDSENVVFFSDEAYRWLVHGGEKVPIKYTAKEFGELDQRAKALGGRLGVGMVEVEKVAYVLFKEGVVEDKAPKNQPVLSVTRKPVPSRKKVGLPMRGDSEETPKKEHTERARGRPKGVKKTSEQNDVNGKENSSSKGGKKREADEPVVEKLRSTRLKRTKV